MLYQHGTYQLRKVVSAPQNIVNGVWKGCFKDILFSYWYLVLFMSSFRVIRINMFYYWKSGRDSSNGIVTRYGLDGPRIEFWWGGRDFPHPSRPAPGPTQPPIQWVPGLSRGGKAAGAWRWPPITSSAKIKERVGLYLYIWAFVDCYRVKLTFTFTFTYWKSYLVIRSTLCSS